MMRMNQLMPAVAAVVMLAGSLTGGAGASAAKVPMLKTNLDIKLLYNARQLPSDVAPEVVSGTTLVPLRVVSDKLGGKLKLTGKNISIVKGKSTLALTIGASTAAINGKSTKLTMPVKVVKGRTLVPLRVVSEGLGVAVEWDSVNQFVWIGNKNVPKLEDAIKPVDIKPYVHYYEKDPGFMKNLLSEGEKPFTTARIIMQMDFPLVISGDIYYRLDLCYTAKGAAYTRASTTDKGVMGRSFLLLQTGQRIKFRQESSGYRESIGDYRIHYNTVVAQRDWFDLNIKDYDKLKIKNIEYIDILADSDAKILFKNPWR